MQVLPPPPTSRGPDILTNPVILESILPELPHLSDILSLQLVSRQLYLLVQPLHPLYAREISLAHLPHVKNKDLITVLHRSLRPGPSTQRRLLADGRTVTVGEGMGKAYVGPWRFLRVITLTGTNITSRSVKLLIAASSGGKIPGLPELLRERQPAMPGNLDPAIDALGITSGFFAKEFGIVSPGAYRLLADQSLRLDKLCVTDCPAVDITDINNFLKKILIVVTAPKRRELRLRASQLVAAQQQNAAPPHNPNAPPGFVAAQQQAQTVQEDLTSIPYPLPATVDELADFGLPCLSLRRLEVANVNGLLVDPPERFRGKKEWDYSKDCPFGRNIGSLNSIAGCLGLDVDVLFCQGAGCATSSDNGRWRQSNPHGFDVDDFDAFDGIIPDLANAREHNPQAPSQTGEGSASAASNDKNNHRRTYHYPLPRLPGERILMTEDGRVFRIPRHAIPNQQNQAAQAQQQQHALNLFQAAMNAQLPAQAPVGAPGAVGVPPAPGAAQAAGNAAAAALNVNQNVWNAWTVGLAGGGGGGGGGGGNGNGNPDANGGAANGWASNLFLQDPAQYGLGVWQQPQQQDNQTQTTAANGQTLMQTLMQNFPGAPGATTIQPHPTPVTAVTPQQPQQQGGVGPVPQVTSVEQASTGIVVATNAAMAASNNMDQGNATIVIGEDIIPADVEYSMGMSGNGEGPSTAPNNAIWQSLLSADGVQTPPYNQQLSPTTMSWSPAVGPPPPTTGPSLAGPSSAAGPFSAALPPPPTQTQTSVIDPAWASFLTTSSNLQTTQLHPGVVVAGPPNPLPLFANTNIINNHPPFLLGQHSTAPAAAPVQDPALAITPVVTNGPTNTNVNFAPFAQLPHTHAQNISLPRRRNNSPGGSRDGSRGGSRSGTGQAGARPGRRIAMLDGPRGLCEGCGREVWLCDSCNRYWVVTCGGCAAKQ